MWSWWNFNGSLKVEQMHQEDADHLGTTQMTGILLIILGSKLGDSPYPASSHSQHQSWSTPWIQQKRQGYSRKFIQNLANWSGRKTCWRILGLLIYCWKTWLFGETQKTQLCLSSASICILLTVTLWVLFRCYKQNCQISSWYQGKGRILIPKMKLHCDMVKLWFFGNWKNYTVMSDVVTVKPWSGYAITYAACPICWLPDKVTAKWDIPKAS